MLEFRNLTKKFGNFTAVDSLNLTINKGNLYGFLGHNGAGKTTTIKMLTGVYAINSGDIILDGVSINDDINFIKRNCGYVPDQPYLYEKLTGREFLFFSGGLYGISKIKIKEKIDEFIEIFKIGNWIDKRTEEYSQGMKQRIAITSAFIHDPRLIILDEPMVGLDPQSSYILKQFLKDKTDAGLTVFMSTHSLNVVEEICNRVGIINNGKLIFDDNIQNLIKRKTELSQNFEELFIELTKD
ncbi:MAG: ABC transporter ATP-binding protein [Ignavibacteriaceae bacterium]|nr:ABC transporter ATP-binding protein [Ignavibacteriaceae bacterium]